MLHAPQTDRMPGPLAPTAAPGHFDELRGGAVSGMAPHWAEFFAHHGASDPAELNQRSASLERQVRDNGVTYNVYADAGGPQRPWSLDLFPLIITPDSWKGIESGILQRVRLLDQVMADIYGPQQLLARGLLPPALVHGHPGYLRPMHGAAPVGGTHLHIAAFDLARGPDGNWWLVSQRTQAPSGLGYLLENRLAVSRQFPQAFENMHVQRLAGTYRALIEHLKSISPGGRDAHIALLTPGPYNETYFEHAYLARYLGLTLVEGGDMLVRDQRLYLKTLKGLVPIHTLLKRLDDQFLDPLELRPDSTLGVPGLLQAVRAGNVLVANAPGSDFLESPALLGFLPGLAGHLLGEDLALPALPTWWCGERNAMEEVLPRLSECAIKPTYPGSVQHGSFEAVLGGDLSPRELDEWAGRIARQGDDHTIQAYLPLAQMPTWQRCRRHGRAHRAAFGDAAGVCGRQRPAVLAGAARRPGPRGPCQCRDRHHAARRQQRRCLGHDPWRRGPHHPARPRPDPWRRGTTQAPGHQPGGREPLLAGPLHRAHRKHHRVGAADTGMPER